MDVIRREVQRAIGGLYFKGHMISTGYDPKKHVVKGILVPHGIETDWIPVGALHIGDGFGIVVGPKAGDAQKLDGDQFDIEFDGGDLNTPIARMRVHSSADNPPEVQSGEIKIRHGKNGQIFWDKDGNVTHQGALEDKQTVKLDKDGNITVQANGGTAVCDKDGSVTGTSKGGSMFQAHQDGSGMLVDSDGAGVVYVDGGKVMLGDRTASIQVLTVAGPAQNVFAKV